MKPQRGPWCPWIWFSKSWQIFGLYHKAFFCRFSSIYHISIPIILSMSKSKTNACLLFSSNFHSQILAEEEQKSHYADIHTSFLVIFQCISKQCWPPGDQGKNLKSGQVQLKMKTLPNDCSSDIHKSNTQCGLYQISVFVEDNDSKTRGYTKVPVTNNVRVH